MNTVVPMLAHVGGHAHIHPEDVVVIVISALVLGGFILHAFVRTLKGGK